MNTTPQQQPNWRVTYANNDGKSLSVEVHADAYDQAISKASAEVSKAPGGLFYFKNAKKI